MSSRGVFRLHPDVGLYPLVQGVAGVGHGPVESVDGIGGGRTRLPQRRTHRGLHRAIRYRPPIGRRRLAPLLRYLRHEGPIPCAEVPPATPLMAFLKEYRQFRLHRRKFAPRTAEGHVTTAQRFLARGAPHERGPFTLDTLAARDATTFCWGKRPA